MIQASDVKAYLRIDYNDDDNFIADVIQTGYDYLADAIDDFSELYSGDEVFSRKADLWVKTQWCPPMYDQREGMLTDKDIKLNYAARAMLTQLQMYRVEEETNDDD
jgi:hypothetical protein